ADAMDQRSLAIQPPPGRERACRPWPARTTAVHRLFQPPELRRPYRVHRAAWPGRAPSGAVGRLPGSEVHEDRSRRGDDRGRWGGASTLIQQPTDLFLLTGSVPSISPRSCSSQPALSPGRLTLLRRAASLAAPEAP